MRCRHRHAILLAFASLPCSRSAGWQTILPTTNTEQGHAEEPLVPLMAPPLEWVKQMTPVYRSKGTDGARTAYLRMLASLLTGLSYECDFLDHSAATLKCISRLRLGTVWGKDLSPYAASMAGLARMRSLGSLIKRVNETGLRGSYAELGTWRGGMSVYAAAAHQLYGLGDRPVYLCDSFAGLPSPRKNSLRPDETFYRAQKYLNVRGAEVVLANFNRYGVPVDQVTAVKGFFRDSMPGFRKSLQLKGEKLAILRLDGDMYDSTIDALYNLYDLVEVGGFVIIDDFGWSANVSFGARDAVIDFRCLHGIEDAEHTMRPVDMSCAYWIKAKEVSLRRDLYEQTVSDGSHSVEQTTRLLRPANSPVWNEAYHKQRHVWEAHLDHHEREASSSQVSSTAWTRLS